MISNLFFFNKNWIVRQRVSIFLFDRILNLFKLSHTLQKEKLQVVMSAYLVGVRHARESPMPTATNDEDICQTLSDAQR